MSDDKNKSQDPEASGDQPKPFTKSKGPTVEIPAKGKVQIKAHVCPGLVRGEFNSVPVNVAYPINTIAPAIGKTVEVAFSEVQEGHAVEAALLTEGK